MKTKDRSKPKKWWDAHYYLAGEIAECADKLAKHQHGYPGIFNKKAASGIPKYSKQNERRWRDILLTIRDGFRLYHEAWGDFYEWKDGKEPPQRDFIKQPDGNWLWPPTPPGYKLIVNKKKEKKFKKAMRLFALYFEHLWD